MSPKRVNIRTNLDRARVTPRLTGRTYIYEGGLGGGREVPGKPVRPYGPYRGRRPLGRSALGLPSSGLYVYVTDTYRTLRARDGLTPALASMGPENLPRPRPDSARSLSAVSNHSQREWRPGGAGAGAPAMPSRENGLSPSSFVGRSSSLRARGGEDHEGLPHRLGEIHVQ